MTNLVQKLHRAGVSKSEIARRVQIGAPPSDESREQNHEKT